MNRVIFPRKGKMGVKSEKILKKSAVDRFGGFDLSSNR